jgi:hypothetical protein
MCLLVLAMIVASKTYVVLTDTDGHSQWTAPINVGGFFVCFSQQTGGTSLRYIQSLAKSDKNV